MNQIVEKLPACPCMPIVQALERLGYDGETAGRRRWLRAEENEVGTVGLAVIVGSSEQRGVASAIYATEERDQPRIEWAGSEGHLLRLYQAAMRRVGTTNSVHLHLLLGGMQ